MKRRRLLGIATTAWAVGIAGCSGGGESEDASGNTDSDESGDSGESTDSDGNGDSGESTDSDENGDGSTQAGAAQSSSVAVAEAYYTAASAEAASEFVHPSSDLEPNSAEYTDEFDVEFLDGEIIAEDVSVQDLEDRDLTLSDITESVLESVGESGDVHLVEATFEYTIDGESGEGTQTPLCATADGEWYVLDTPAQTA